MSKQNISTEENPLFVDINPDCPITEMESLCMSCHEQGITRIMMTSIPFFKDIYIMNFICPHCHYVNNGIESAQELAPKGIHFVLKVTQAKDLNRRVIKSNFATISVPSCKLEIPSSTQQGKLSTVEGFMTTTRDNLKTSYDSGYYSEMGEEYIEGVRGTIEKLTDALSGKIFPFEFILDDPSGNSFIENPYAPQSDPYIKVSYYERTKEMIESMGYSVSNEINEHQTQAENDADNNDNTSNDNNVKTKPKPSQNTINSTENNNKTPASSSSQVKHSYYEPNKEFTVYKPSNEAQSKLLDFTKSYDEKVSMEDTVSSMVVNCNVCSKPGELRTCLCTIPYFKEIDIISFRCEYCGYKTTEVKGGGGIADKGMRLTLQVTTKEDLNRDCFKSESCKIKIPEIQFETALDIGSMYTTVEGLIDKICENLENMPFSSGDSAVNSKITLFIKNLRELQNLKHKFTLILDDPLSNSFIFPIGEPDKDERLKKEEYERTFEQNEEYGINDMKTEGYEGK